MAPLPPCFWTLGFPPEAQGLWPYLSQGPERGARVSLCPWDLGCSIAAPQVGSNSLLEMKACLFIR